MTSVIGSTSPRSDGAAVRTRRSATRCTPAVRRRKPVGSTRPGAVRRQRPLRCHGSCSASQYCAADSRACWPPVYRPRSRCAPTTFAAPLSNVQSGCSPTSVANAFEGSPFRHVQRPTFTGRLSTSASYRPSFWLAATMASKPLDCRSLLSALYLSSAAFEIRR
jgi:hypothetical protein